MTLCPVFRRARAVRYLKRGVKFFVIRGFVEVVEGTEMGWRVFVIDGGVSRFWKR